MVVGATGSFSKDDVCGSTFVIGIKGSKVSNPRKDFLEESEQAKYNRSTEDRRIYEVQINFFEGALELPRRYTARGQEVLCAAPQETFSKRIVEGYMPLVRILGQEYFSSTADWLIWNQLESIHGRRPLWPARIFIVMKSNVELREPWKPPINTGILQGKVMSLLHGYITDDLNEREISAKVTDSRLAGCIDIEVRCLAIQEDGKGIGVELPVNGGLLACFVSKCLKEHLASQNDWRYIVVVHEVDAWYSLGNNRKGPATYIVRGFYKLCRNMNIYFLCTKAYASLIANLGHGEELIEIKGLRVAGSHACYYQGGAL
ncbi:hypothetical protein OROGR_028508 [Orobanche gracilis]